jgi:hypothetical protein
MWNLDKGFPSTVSITVFGRSLLPQSKLHGKVGSSGQILVRPISKRSTAVSLLQVPRQTGFTSCGCLLAGYVRAEVDYVQSLRLGTLQEDGHCLRVDHSWFFVFGKPKSHYYKDTSGTVTSLTRQAVMVVLWSCAGGFVINCRTQEKPTPTTGWDTTYWISWSGKDVGQATKSR